MKKTSTRERRNPDAELIHFLNRRYRDEWRRAEALQDELDCLRGSGFWKTVAWMRWLKQRIWPPVRPPAPPLAACAVPYVEPCDWRRPRGRVSIVIPFKDRPELLRNCLRSLTATTYRRFEVVLVDNGSAEARTQELLASIRERKRIRIVLSPGAFNFSTLCNAGADAARGDFLLFLNNDTEVLDRDWLRHLVRLAMDERVGAVGATLLYPDRTLQHVGLFPRADGRWVHPYRGRPADEPGTHGELRLVRTVPAATAACLLVRTALFHEVGGFDERYPIAHNDVDLCERLRRRGLLIALTPHARLLHYEGLSRGIEVD